jgi:hypothetical protein
MTMKDPGECSEAEKKQIEHGPELYPNHGRTMQEVADSTSVQSFGEGQGLIPPIRA